MYPTLLKIGNFEISSYGVFLALAFVVSLIFVSYRAKRENLSVHFIHNMALWVILSAIVGARLLYVLSTLPYHLEHPHEIIFSRAGFVFYGGLLSGIATAIIYLKLKHQPILRIVNLLTPALPLGESITRIGCFLYGCCYGKPTKLFIAISLHRHPTQIYNLLAAFAIFLFLVYQPNKKYTFFYYLMLHGFFRFIIDFFRQDLITIGYLTFTQYIAICLFIFGLAMFLHKKRCLK